MKAKGILVFLVALCFAYSLFGQTPEELIAQGDALFNEMKNMSEAKEAEALYHKAIGQMDNKYEAFWRLSRILYYIGEHTEKKKEKKSIFAQGVYYAERAIDLEPEKPKFPLLSFVSPFLL